jgi:NAD(P)-dependent dehydrogenase (short-subunit alcohol dehydrogenase family)
VKSPFDLSGRVAIVTGAGRGIGAAIAGALADHGASVARVDVVIENVTQGYQCDVSDDEQVRACVEQIVSQEKRLDILVNNAGIHRGHSPFNFPEADIDLLLRTNLLGCFYFSRAAAAHMIAQGSGSIVNVSALGGGVVGLGRGGSIYGATKGGVVSLTRDFAAEWARHGVRVNAVAPGWIRTPMTRVMQQNEQLAGKMLTQVPMGRWGVPQDVAGPVVFLASDAAAYVTGQVLPVDGGAASIIPFQADS